MRIVRTFSLVLVMLASSLSAACGGNEPPSIQAIGEKVAYVNSSFELRVTASDPDGDNLKFSYSSDIPEFKSRPGVEFLQDGSSALLRFTPLPGDVGHRTFDFTVSDGKDSDKTQAYVEIRYAPSSNAPIFREPLGTGTLLDLSKTDSMKLKIVVEDPDNSDVTIDQESPLIEGAKLDQDSGLTAWWSWTPTPEQIASTDRFVLTLSANDQSNPVVLKNYLIVLRKGNKANCPGQAPVINHTPSDFSQVTGLVVDMVATDDQGLGVEPLLYYSFQDPGSPPDLTQMMQTTMLLIDGDPKNGTWGADVPNPVAGQPTGSSSDLYYVFVAQDDDDAEGDCDHLTQSPATGAHHVKVTNPGGQGGLGVCEPCTSDVQCGGASDNCLPLGSSGEGRCGKACSSDSDCPGAEYYCSISTWDSVDGVPARQCIPTSFECGGAGPGDCTDDSYDSGAGNDTLKSVESAAGITPGTIDAVSCPGVSGADEDWYVFDLTADATVTLSITGGSTSDLALQLIDPGGNALETSNTLGSKESLTRCLTKGYYFARVYSKDTAENSYSLTFKTTAGSCVCEDDPDEEDDGSSTARNVTLDGTLAYKSNTNVICPWDEDWYKVALIAGETVYASLLFDQANDKEDLDIRFYQGSTLLTKCTESDDSGCDSANGQSPDSNENFKWKAPASGTYYVVVHGWAGSSNLYDICIGLNQAQCPALP